MEPFAEDAWAGKLIICVAGGSSFTAKDARLIGIARARDKCRVIAVNDAIYPCWFADIAYGCDARWWVAHEGLPGYGGHKVALEPTGIPDVITLTNTGTTDVEFDFGRIRSGGNGGYQAIQVAVQLGSRDIALVGYDLQGAHWFGKHPNGLHKPDPSFRGMVSCFVGLADIMRKAEVRIVNTSSRSALRGFQWKSLEAVLTTKT